MDTKILLCLLLLLALSYYFILEFGYACRRADKYYSSFYKPLREKYPRSYVRQNRVLKAFRKRFKMDTTSRVHWAGCAVHYLQMIMIFSSLLPLIAFLSACSIEVVSVLFWVGWLCPHILSRIFYWIFMLSQYYKCLKIQETDRRYATIELPPYKFW